MYGTSRVRTGHWESTYVIEFFYGMDGNITRAGNRTYLTFKCLLMVFKEYEVDLYGFMDPYKNGVCEEYVIQILRSAADAVQYMHQQGVYHLDIKPENLVSEPSPVAVVKHMLWPYAPPHSPTAPLPPAHRTIISACARHSTVPLHFDTRFNE